MESAIEISGLVKTFGPTRALDGLDLTVARGEVHGFLGPNGAGKSTTIRVLLGLLHGDAGEARLLGGDPWADATTLELLSAGNDQQRPAKVARRIFEEMRAQEISEV